MNKIHIAENVNAITEMMMYINDVHNGHSVTITETLENYEFKFEVWGYTNSPLSYYVRGNKLIK